MGTGKTEDGKSVIKIKIDIPASIAVGTEDIAINKKEVWLEEDTGFIRKVKDITAKGKVLWELDISNIEVDSNINNDLFKISL